MYCIGTIHEGSSLTTTYEFHMLQIGAEIACALDKPSISFKTRSKIQCSIRCKQWSTNCEHLNVKDILSEGDGLPIVCELYNYVPSSYQIVQSCAHYQVIN